MTKVPRYLQVGINTVPGYAVKQEYACLGLESGQAQVPKQGLANAVQSERP